MSRRRRHSIPRTRPKTRINLSASPDVTGSVMNRLGFIAVDTETRRNRFSLIGGRVVMGLVVAAGLGIATRIQVASAEAERAAHVTLPTAIGQAMVEREESVRHWIEALRGLATPDSAAGHSDTGTPEVTIAMAPYSSI